jgi:hypothetical protein
MDYDRSGIATTYVKSPVGHDRDPLYSQNLFCRFGGLCQQTHIHNLVRNLLFDD